MEPNEHPTSLYCDTRRMLVAAKERSRCEETWSSGREEAIGLPSPRWPQSCLCVIDVGGRNVLISIGLVDLEDRAKLDRAVELLEPIVQAITWG